jgi:hypothetical protein
MTYTKPETDTGFNIIPGENIEVMARRVVFQICCSCNN